MVFYSGGGYISISPYIAFFIEAFLNKLCRKVALTSQFCTECRFGGLTAASTNSPTYFNGPVAPSAMKSEKKCTFGKFFP